ncbi:MAG: DUF7670 domain-containing protein [Bryobacteraceae bacterium]
MTQTRMEWIVWAPRVLAILFACFLSVFALDAFSEGRPWSETLPALIVHLVPTWLVLLVLVFAWRRPWIGAAGFTVLALAYSFWARGHAAWILVIAGPLLVLAGLFYWSCQLTGAHRPRHDG